MPGFIDFDTKTITFETGPFLEVDCLCCYDNHPDKTPFNRPFIVCRTCGNKRCPKATNHNLACSGSNEPGQQGSEWGEHEPCAKE
jgi:hypothetical protein